VCIILVADGVLCSTIQRLKNDLMFMIEPDTTKGELLNLNALPLQHVHACIHEQQQDKLTAYMKNVKLIECFAGQSEDVCYLFIVALNKSNQKHVANFITAAAGTFINEVQSINRMI